MKNKITFIFMAILGIMMTTSCSHNNPNSDTFEDDPTLGYLKIISKTPVIGPATDSLHLVIKNRVQVAPKDIVINYELVSIQGPNPDTFLHRSGSTITIPAGEDIVNLDFDIDADLQESLRLNDKQIEFKIVLKSNSDKILAVKKLNTAQYIYPCKIDPADTYAGKMEVPSIAYPATAFGVYDVTMTKTADNIYHASNLVNPNWVAVLTANDGYIGQYNIPATLIIDPATLDVQVIAENPQASDGGTGSYNYCSDVWSITLHQGVFGPSVGDLKIELSNQ